MSTRSEKKIFNERIKRLYDKGILKPIDHALEFRNNQDIEVIEKICVREIDEMREALGKTHQAIINLKSTLISIYREQGNPRLLSILEEMVDELLEDPTRGRDNQDYVLCKCDLGTILMLHGRVDEGQKTLQESYEASKRILGMDDMRTLMTGMNLAKCLQFHGKAKAAHELASAALKGFKMTLGDLHQHTIGVEDLYRERLMFEGKFDLAARQQKTILKKMGQISGNDNPGTIHAAIELITTLLLAGKFEEAEQENQDFKKELGVRHPARELLDGPIAADTLLYQGRYTEAAQIFDSIRTKLARFPWPPPKIPQSPGMNPERLKIRNGGAGPEDFPSNPDLLDCSIKYAIALQAHAQAEKKLGNDVQASKSSMAARKSLSHVMVNMSKVFGGDPWVGISAEPGLAGSALNTAMTNGQSYSLDILVRMGATNARDGIHYEEAIEVAADHKLPNIVAILQEHQLICGGTQHGRDFNNHAQLRSFVNGNWQGSYLYERGPGFRRNKTGKATFTLLTVDDPSNPGVVSIDGHGLDDRGETEYKGEVSMGGEFTILLSPKGEGIDMAWKYSGYLNVERNAMGGRWGFRNTTQSLGTFFFYKV